jgi:SAM-dependent methyltransferase
MPRSSDAIAAAVREQYETFPFPPVEHVLEEDDQRDLRSAFNLDLGLSGARALPPYAQIWVPGCGTRWAVLVAIQFRDARILATDISSSSLARQQNLAQALGVTNIEWRCEDMVRGNRDQEFDFVSCVGVLHHLPEPDSGFAAIARALRPTGIAEIMVYDELNRGHSKRMQQALATLDPGRRLTAQERFDVAIRLLRGLNRHASVPKELPRVLRYLDSSRGFARELADFVSHPQEHYFDVPSLVAGLARAGLRVRSWKMPHRFDPALMMDDQALRRDAGALDPVDRAHLGQLLSSALLEVFIERADAPPSCSTESLLDRAVRASPIGYVHHLDDREAIVRRETYAKLLWHHDRLVFDGGDRRPGVVAYGLDVDCIRGGTRRLQAVDALGFATPLNAAHVRAIVEYAREPTPVRQVIDRVLRDRRLPTASSEDVLALCSHLCRTPYRVLLAT